MKRFSIALCAVVVLLFASEAAAAKKCPGGVCPTAKAPASNVAILQVEVAAAVVPEEKAAVKDKRSKRVRSRRPLRSLFNRPLFRRGR